MQQKIRLKKNFQDKELQHELFITTRQKTKIRCLRRQHVES